jgi:hypothetical protein
VLELETHPATAIASTSRITAMMGIACFIYLRIYRPLYYKRILSFKLEHAKDQMHKDPIKFGSCRQAVTYVLCTFFILSTSAIKSNV